MEKSRGVCVCVCVYTCIYMFHLAEKKHVVEHQKITANHKKQTS